MTETTHFSPLVKCPNLKSLASISFKHCNNIICYYITISKMRSCVFLAQALSIPCLLSKAPAWCQWHQMTKQTNRYWNEVLDDILPPVRCHRNNNLRVWGLAMHIPSSPRKYMNGCGHWSDGSVKTHITLTL